MKGPLGSGEPGRFVNQNKFYSPVNVHSTLGNVTSVSRESYAGAKALDEFWAIYRVSILLIYKLMVDTLYIAQNSSSAFALE